MDAQLEDLFATALVTGGLQRDELRKASNVDKKVKPKGLKKPIDYRYISYIFGVIVILLALGTPKYAYKAPIKYIREYFEDYVYSSEANCLVSHSSTSIEATRPIVKCSMCKGVTEVISFLSFFLVSTCKYITMMLFLEFSLRLFFCGCRKK